MVVWRSHTLERRWVWLAGLANHHVIVCLVSWLCGICGADTTRAKQLFHMRSTISLAWRLLHRPRVYLTVEPILFLFSFASFLSYAVLQEFLYHLVCQRTPNCLEPSHNGTTTFSDEEGGGCPVPGPVQQLVQKETSHWVLYINMASGVPSILVSILYGHISDLKGRRVFMILPALGSILNQTVVLLVVYLHHTLSLSFLLVGAFALGIGGTFPVFNFAVYSYVSDVSSQAKRTVHISILESMTFLGATASLLVGGRWVNNIHFAGPMYCIIAIELVVVAYVIVALPESIPKQRGAPQQQPSLSSQGSSTYPEQFSPQRPRHHMCELLYSSCINLVAFLKLFFWSWKLILLLGMFFVVEINFLGINDTVILFAQGDPLCWGTDIIGYFLASKVFLNGLATLFVLPLLSLVGFRDADLVVVGLVAGGAGLALMGSSSHTWMMFLGEYQRYSMVTARFDPGFTLTACV